MDEFTLELEPGQIEEVKYGANIHYDADWLWEYEVTPDTKTVTKQLPETRYKKVSLFEYLLHY